MTDNQMDDILARAEHEGMSHLQFVHGLISDQASLRKERSIERRIKEACFRDSGTLESFDWKFNQEAIDRARIEDLASGQFVRRGENLVKVGQSGVGKSHLIQGIGRRCCALGYRVRYTTSADLVKDLARSRADETLASRLRYYGRVQLLIIDEFGFDRLERTDCPQAANLLYKVIEARYPGKSTALVTNVDFESWDDYLGDPPLAMAFLDRVVDGAIILKIEGESYRAHRARRVNGNEPVGSDEDRSE
ncbi:MAG: IS21-like element helper ATPase IstB [Planctomycetota bacterium]|jgi:DNA replication protein DnaC|nr:IS21-like element helper ATPase IstB [Planctomycetota bacterium]